MILIIVPSLNSQMFSVLKEQFAEELDLVGGNYTKDTQFAICT